MIGSTAVRRYNVSLPPEIAEALRALGTGNMSEGIRRALRGDQMDKWQALGDVEFMRITGEGHFGRVKVRDALVYMLPEPARVKWDRPATGWIDLVKVKP